MMRPFTAATAFHEGLAADRFVSWATVSFCATDVVGPYPDNSSPEDLPQGQ